MILQKASFLPTKTFLKICHALPLTLNGLLFSFFVQIWIVWKWSVRRFVKLWHKNPSIRLKMCTFVNTNDHPSGIMTWIDLDIKTDTRFLIQPIIGLLSNRFFTRRGDLARQKIWPFFLLYSSSFGSGEVPSHHDWTQKIAATHTEEGEREERVPLFGTKL